MIKSVKTKYSLLSHKSESLNYANDASCLIQQVKMFHSRIQSRAAMEEQPSELITEDAQQQ